MDEQEMQADTGLEAPAAPDTPSDASTEAKPQDDLPHGVKERIARQEKKHQREMRQMQQQLAAMQNAMAGQNQAQQQQQPTDDGVAAGSGANGDIITRAVQEALQQKDRLEAQAKQQASMQELHQKYQDFDDSLNSASEKYDDFDEVVRGKNVPFSPAMRDAALLVDNPGDVLYKLGKNPEELKRLNALHPVDQAKEIVRLSKALIKEDGTKANTSNAEVLDPIKPTPAKTTSDPTKMSVAELRQYKRMRRR